MWLHSHIPSLSCHRLIIILLSISYLIYHLSLLSSYNRYPNIILIMLGCTFFFNKKMVCSSSVSTFIAKTLNSIIKSTVFYFPYLKNSIFYLASAVFVLLLKVILIFLTNSSQSWVPSSSSSSFSFLWV